MTITFPNRSRSYDATRRAVRFWGYDRSMESSFFIMIDALRQMQPNLRSNSIDILRAFDDNRERIYAIAAKVYAEVCSYSAHQVIGPLLTKGRAL
jgi:hypothetical protein